jgi:predicted MFS family arabinose efflux permease
MHAAEPAQTSPGPRADERVTAYHWLVVVIASAGWLFDCMDQRLFVLARESALTELLGNEVARATVKKFGGYATTILMLGWATGGIIFGIMSDRLGRVKTMMATLMVYSGFTGLSGLSVGWTDFLVYRFLVGLGVGGMFGAATTLVAESVPSSIRTVALGSLQTLSAVGNITGSLVSYLVPPGKADFLFGYSGWRFLFFVGILPSLLVVPIMWILKEPEPWRRARAAVAAGQQKKAGSLKELFGHPIWRRNAIAGLMIGFSGMAGLWGIAFFSPELISTALASEPIERVDRVRSIALALQDVGAFAGMFAFTFVAARVARRAAFLGSLVLCIAVVSFVFYSLHSATDAYWMLPLMGCATLSVFAGYAIYFPELFPTRLRGTGVGFCYNTVRYLAAPVPALLGQLSEWMGSFRNAAIAMTAVYLVGILALLWAPETKGKPLPED